MALASDSCGSFTGFRTGAGGGQPLRHPSAQSFVDRPRIPSLANIPAPPSVGNPSPSHGNMSVAWSPPWLHGDEDEVRSINEGCRTEDGGFQIDQCPREYEDPKQSMLKKSDMPPGLHGHTAERVADASKGSPTNGLPLLLGRLGQSPASQGKPMKRADLASQGNASVIEVPEMYPSSTGDCRQIAEAAGDTSGGVGAQSLVEAIASALEKYERKHQQALHLGYPTPGHNGLLSPPGLADKAPTFEVMPPPPMPPAVPPQPLPGMYACHANQMDMDHGMPPVPPYGNRTPTRHADISFSRRQQQQLQSWQPPRRAGPEFMTTHPVNGHFLQALERFDAQEDDHASVTLALLQMQQQMGPKQASNQEGPITRQQSHAQQILPQNTSLHQLCSPQRYGQQTCVQQPLAQQPCSQQLDEQNGATSCRPIFRGSSCISTSPPGAAMPTDLPKGPDRAWGPAFCPDEATVHNSRAMPSTSTLSRASEGVSLTVEVLRSLRQGAAPLTSSPINAVAASSPPNDPLATVIAPPPGLSGPPGLVVAQDSTPIPAVPPPPGLIQLPEFSRKSEVHSLTNEDEQLPQADRNTPQSRTSDAGDKAEFNHHDDSKRHTCKFIFSGFDVEEHADFELVPRLIGRGGSHMREIAAACNGKVRIRGRGSGHKELRKGTRPALEADVPLQIALSCRDRCSFEEGKTRLEQFLKGMSVHFERYCKRKCIDPIPELYTVSGDA